MNKNFLVLPVFLLSLSFFNPSDFNKNLRNEIRHKFDSKILISSSASFDKQVRDFNAGETIFVKVTADSDGSSKKVLNLRDNSYNIISAHSFSVSGPGPYSFEANLKAPGEAGNYSLEAEIESEGSNTVLVRTIEVRGNINEGTSVEVNIENEVLGEGEKAQDLSPVEGGKESTGSGEAEVEKKSLLSSMFDILKGIFSFFF